MSSRLRLPKAWPGLAILIAAAGLAWALPAAAQLDTGLPGTSQLDTGQPDTGQPDTGLPGAVPMATIGTADTTQNADLRQPLGIDVESGPAAAWTNARPPFGTTAPTIGAPDATPLPWTNAPPARKIAGAGADGLRPQSGPLWTITPSITISEAATDNVRQASSHRQADLISTVTPELYVSGETPRLRATLDYAPTLQRYVTATDQNAIDQQLFGAATVTLVPDTLHIDANAAAFQASLAGGAGGINPQNLPLANRTQVLAYNVSPVLQTRVFDTGTAELRYTLGQTRLYGNGGALATPENPYNTQSNNTDQSLRGVLDSADTFNRLDTKLILALGHNDDSLGISTMKQSNVTSDNSYHITDSLALRGSVGYETFNFAADPGENINDVTYLGGFTYAPRPESSVTLLYGHYEGVNDFQGSLRYAVTPITKVFADYSDQIMSDQQEILSNLQGSTLGSNGQITDTATGLPSNLFNNEFGLQDSVYRFRTLNAGLITTLDPNIITVTFQRQTADTLIGPAPSDMSTGGIVSWTRLMTPLTRANFSLGYYVHQVGNQGTFSAGAEIDHNFGPSLVGSAAYVLNTSTATAGSSGSFYQNYLVFSLRKIF